MEACWKLLTYLSCLAGGCLSVAVVDFHPVAVFAAADSLDPVLVAQVPLYGGGQSLLKGHLPLPAQLLLDFGAVDGVAAVVAGTILYVGDGLTDCLGGLSQLLGRQLNELVQQLDVLPLVFATDVVFFTSAALPHDLPNRPVVVLYINPVTDVSAVAVHGKTLALAHVQNHQGKELFRELVGAVVVGAIGKGDGQAVGVEVGHGQVVAGCLTGGVGAAGVVGGGLHKVAGLSQGAVHLVGGHVVEQDALLESIFRLPEGAGGVQQGVGSHHIGADKGLRPQDGAVHMAFRRKVDDGVDGVFSEDCVHGGTVADVRLLKEVAAAGLRAARPEFFLDVRQALPVACVGEAVHVHHGAGKACVGKSLVVGGGHTKQVVDKVAADKTGAACYQNTCQLSCSHDCSFVISTLD